MKKAFQVMLVILCITTLFSCKKTDLGKAPTEEQVNAILLRSASDLQLIDFAFHEDLNFSTLLTQSHSTTTRTLIRFANPRNSDAWKYLLLESDTTSNSNSTQFTFLVSRDSVIDNSVDFYALPLIHEGVVNFDVWPNNPLVDYESTYGIKIKITDTYGDTSYNVNTRGTDCRVPIACLEVGTETCIDSWWVTYIVGTGEVIGVIYDPICTIDCPPSGGGGGGSTSSGCENVSVAEAQALINGIVKTNTNNFSSTSGPITTDPNTFAEIQYVYPVWDFMTVSLWGIFWESKYKISFTGVRTRVNSSSPWTWISFTKTGTAVNTGSLPPCVSEAINDNSPQAVKNSDSQARGNLDVTVNYTYTCLMGSSAGSRTRIDHNFYYANGSY